MTIRMQKNHCSPAIQIAIDHYEDLLMPSYTPEEAFTLASENAALTPTEIILFSTYLKTRVSLETALHAFIHAYQSGENGNAIDWSDMDSAYALACEALGISTTSHAPDTK